MIEKFNEDIVILFLIGMLILFAEAYSLAEANHLFLY